MDPTTLTAISHVAQAAKAATTATVSSPVRRFTLRYRVALTTKFQSRRHGISIRYRDLVRWLKSRPTRDQFAEHTAASMEEAIQSLSALLPGPASERKQAEALLVLKLVLHNLLSAAEPSDAVAQSHEWLMSNLDVQFSETRAAVQEAQSQVLQRLDARDNFETGLQALPPWRRSAATELRNHWPGVEQVVERLSTAGDRKAAMMREWSQQPPAWLKTSPPEA